MNFELVVGTPSPAPRPASLPACRAAGLSADDLCALERAVNELERYSWASRLTVLLRRQAGIIGWAIPGHISRIANKVAVPALEGALKVALRSLDGKPLRDRRGFHRGVAALAGGAGGAFGLSSLVVELPFTTTIMLRSIADIARNEGEDLTDPATALACLAVFGLGSGRTSAVDAPGVQDEAILETGYFAIRALLASSVGNAARVYLGRGTTTETMSAVAGYLASIGSRFGVAVSQKVAAQAVPLIGAAAGAAINYAFVDHFQTVARGHFTILRLERRYGATLVREQYEHVLRRA